MSDNPVSLFFADPRSHLADVLYLNFRDYKRKLIYRFFTQALARIDLGSERCLRAADVGASMGFDLKYVMTRLNEDERARPKWRTAVVTLVEGDDALIAAGDDDWSRFAETVSATHRYVKSDLARGLALPDTSQHIVICSEVVEHLEDPGRLLREIHRVLEPGGYLILTTDNCPSALQSLKRVRHRISGRYAAVYARPGKADTITGEIAADGSAAPIFGHINLNPTRHWERLAREAGLTLASYGTYESVRRGGGRRTPGLLAMYFATGYVVSLLPRRVGRFFGDTTALLLTKDRRPAAPPS
jgi:SAM-dependent methyltransferase